MTWAILGPRQRRQPLLVLLQQLLFALSIWDSYSSATAIVTSATVDKRRPFYNIAHMVNSLVELDFYLAEGANAIESDVTFLENGKAEYLYHGMPCDYMRICNRKEKLEEYLQKVKELSTAGNSNYVKSFVLQVLDLKLTDVPAWGMEEAGATFAGVIVEHLFDYGKHSTQIKLLLSHSNSDDIDFVIGFRDELLRLNLTHLNDRIGFDFGGFEDVLKIRNTIARVPGIKNIWFNDGITNVLSYFWGVGRLKDALRLRDDCNEKRFNKCPKKVYRWTIDLPSELRSTLSLPLDGIITNNPSLLNEILAEKPFVDQFRLADVNDDPLEYFEEPINCGNTQHVVRRMPQLLICKLDDIFKKIFHGEQVNKERFLLSNHENMRIIF